MASTDFNWVSALSACSLDKVFQQMRAAIEADVEFRNGQRPHGAAYEFSTVVKDNHLIVLLGGNGVLPNRRVKFTKNDRSIAVFDGEDRQMFEAYLTLNDIGDCRLKINGQEREFWQARRMALEDLFFGDIWRKS